MATGRLDAVVLAAAGLARLGRLDEATDVLSYDVMLPAPGQGALAVETASRRRARRRWWRCSTIRRRASAVLAERAVLGALEAGCSAPVGALAQVSGDELQLQAAVGLDAGGVRRWVESGSAGEPDAVGRRLAGPGARRARWRHRDARLRDIGGRSTRGGGVEALDVHGRTVGRGSPVTTRARKKPAVGSVAFVGAGPGDPGLLTLRAAELLAAATCGRARRRRPCRGARARRRRRGGGGGRHRSRRRAARPRGAGPRWRSTWPRTAASSVRLLQGDPGLFGGVGEEAAACTRAKVPFEIVPGVSSVTAVPAYAGLPLTSSRQREVHVVDATAAGVDWARHAHGGGTLVLLNALGVLGTVSAALVAAGRDPQHGRRGDEVGDDHRADHPGHDAGVRGRRRARPAADRARGRRGR